MLNGNMQFPKLKYTDLTPKQQEIFNFQKAAAILADYGFKVIKLSDDWNGADFIAQHFNTDSFLKVQLKGRWTLDKKYCGKDIWICFRDEDAIYLYPHDEVMDRVLKEAKFMKGSESWEVRGGYNRGSLSKELKDLMEKYRLE